MFLRTLLLCAVLLVLPPLSSFGADMITGLDFSPQGDLSETILLRGRGRLFPDVAVLNDDSPRIVYDFIGVRKTPEIKDIPGGRFVRAVRIGIHRTPARKVRMVLDMEPNRSYAVNHSFDEKNGVFRVDVRAADAPVPTGKTMAVAFSHLPLAKPAATVQAPARHITDKGQTAPPAETPQNPPAPAATPLKAPAKTGKPEHKAAPPAAATEEKQQQTSRRLSARIDHIRISRNETGKETVLFTMKGFSAPRIRAVEDKEHVRLLCDFPSTSFPEGLAAEVRGTQGEMIRRIVVAAGEGDKTGTRVTLELSLGRSYNVQQFFFKEDNLFAVILQDMESKSQP